MDAPQNERQGNAAAIVFGTAGLLMLGLQPILLEQLILAGRTDLDGAGLLAMAEIIAIGVGAAGANLLLPLAGLRLTATLATLLLAGMNLLTPEMPDAGGLFAVRIGAGFAGGVLVWIATQAIVRFHAPERLAGLYLLLQSCGQAAAAFALTVWAIPQGALHGGFEALALFCLLPLLLLFALPPRFAERRVEAHSLPPANRQTIFTALAILCGMAVIGALWTFLEALGRAAGLPAHPVQLTIAGVLLAQLLGAGCASWLSPRRNAVRTLLVCNFLLLLIGIAYLAMPGGDLAWFVVICCAFGFVWLYAMPFHVKQALTVDPEGRLAVQVPALQLLGSALGPMTAALFMEGDTQVAPAFVTGTVYAALAFVLIALAGKQRATA